MFSKLKAIGRLFLDGLGLISSATFGDASPKNMAKTVWYGLAIQLAILVCMFLAPVSVIVGMVLLYLGIIGAAYYIDDKCQCVGVKVIVDEMRVSLSGFKERLLGLIDRRGV